MAKRFIDTDCWNKAWFRRLDLNSKIAWLYIITRCDLAGVWDPDYELADFHIGKKLDWSSVKSDLLDSGGKSHPRLFSEEDPEAQNKPRVKILSSGKWMILDFIPFQYGELSPACKPHQRVLEMVGRHGIENLIPERGSQREAQDPDQEIPGPYSPQEFAEFWALYPVKKEKDGALKKFIQARKRASQLQIMEGLKKYVAWIQDTGTTFIKYPKTWLNNGCWADAYTLGLKRAGSIQIQDIIDKLKKGESIKYDAVIWGRIPEAFRKSLEIDSDPKGNIIKLKGE